MDGGWRGVLGADSISGRWVCPSTWRCPVLGGGSLKALYSEPPLQRHFHLLPPSLQRWRRVRNAQRLRLEESERRSLLSPHRAPQRQLLSRGTARGHRRVSAPALGGWEGDAVNGAKLPPGTEAGAPRRGGAWSAAGPRPAPARGCAPGRRGPRVPPPAPKAPGSVKRPLAPQGRRITLEQHRQDLHLAFAALTAQSAFLQHPRATKQRERPWNLLVSAVPGRRPGAHTSTWPRGAGSRPVVRRRSKPRWRGSCLPAAPYLTGRETSPPSRAIPPTSHLPPNLRLPLGHLPLAMCFALRFGGSQGHGRHGGHIVSTQ